MPETKPPTLSGVSETLLVTLYLRAMESLRPDALIKDDVWVHNIQMSTNKVVPRTRWGIWRGREIEGWGSGIRLLDEWGFFDCREPRLASIRWMRPFEALARTLRIYHFRLGEAAG